MEDYVIKQSQKEKLQEILTNRKLNVQCNTENLCTKNSRNFGVLACVSLYKELSKRKSLLNACFSSQCNYCSLIWMCHIRLLNSKLNRLHERWLILLYNDKQPTFEQPLDKDSCVHISNLQTHVIEMYKAVNGSTP